MHWFASFTVTNHARRWKEWRPYPVSAWLVGVVALGCVGRPTIPSDDETVVDVQLLEPAIAIAFLSGVDDGQAQLVALALGLGLLDP